MFPNYLFNQLEKKIKNTDGQSPAEVYRCRLQGKNVYLKTINNIFANTTYSVKREAGVMKWLHGRLNVPELLETRLRNDKEYLIMSELQGRHIDTYMNEPIEYISYMAAAIKKLQEIDISQCPFDSTVDVRLKELKYLLDNELADVDTNHWEETTEFSTPNELYQWLCSNVPKQELVFSHGDVGANFFVKNDDIYFYDLARGGMADKWCDIAFCVRDIRRIDYNKSYEKKFFEMLKVEPDYEKINYYILLDEMF